MAKNFEITVKKSDGSDFGVREVVVAKNFEITVKKSDGSDFSVKFLEVPEHDVDFALILPNGKQIVLQWRVESVSLGVRLPGKEHLVTCLQGGTMKPASAYRPESTEAEKKRFAPGHVRRAKQLVIELGPKYLGKKS